MRKILRSIFSNIFFILFIVVIILTITFLVFPFKDFNLLWRATFFNVHYISLIGAIIVIAGLLKGIFSGQQERQQIRYIERQLRQLHEGQALIEEEYKDLQQVDQLMMQIQHKIAQQIEYAQQLATEQANEREASLQEIVVEERNRLARDLHDAVSQQLFAASMMMSAITEEKHDVSPTLEHQLSMVEKMIQQSQLEMRALLLHLRPVQLKGKHLQEGIDDLIKELMARLPIELEQQIEQFPIDKGVEDQLFRILQEAVSNTLRHAEANTLKITLIKRDGFIIMRVIDDGKGFKLSEANTSSYGLDTMKERSEELGGTFKIVSLPNKGTQIEVKIPTIHE